MDVGTNKTRKDTRAVVSLVARYRSPSTFEYVEEACCDVSLGGMFIRSKDPAPAGTLLKLECESGVGEQIRGVARVVWLRAQQNEYGPSGMGVKFVKLDPESRDLITRIVQELAEAGIESPSMSSAPEQRGKPPSRRPNSPAPAAAEAASPPPPPPPPATSSKPPELSVTQPARPARALSSSPPRNDVAVLHRASDRAAGTPPPPPPISSKPPVPGVSSRPAPSNALLAHANVEPLEIEPSSSGSALAPLQELGRDLSPPQEIGRDLAPLQAMVRSSRVSSAPPPEERSGRAFWLVAGAVVALGAIVAFFSMRAARETVPGEPQANGDSALVVEAPSPTAMNPTDPAPSAAPAEGASAEPADPELTAQPGAQAAEAADPEQVAATEPSEGTAAPAAAPEAEQPAHPSAATEGTAAPPPTAAQQDNAAPAASSAVQPGSARPTTSASSATAAAPTRAAELPPPVIRIVPEPATSQPSAAAEAAPPSAASPSQAPATPAAPSSSPAAATAASKEAQQLPPGELARVIMFTSRPSGATVFVADQTVTTPGELNLGAMPPRIRVTAQKEGYESSTVWINNVAEFQKVGGVLRREVHFVLHALPTPPAAAVPPVAQPQATSASVAPEQAPGQP